MRRGSLPLTSFLTVPQGLTRTYHGHSTDKQSLQNMPPHLRLGIPVEQRLPSKPRPLHLCTCWQCYSQTAIDPATLEVEQGVYVPWNVYQQHLDNDKTRGIAPPQTFNTVVSFDLALAN